jgi:hypothetical protein
MKKLKDVESMRASMQIQLDLQKNSIERNKLGQFATPNELALQIAKYVKKYYWPSGTQIKFLDPCIGTGSFYSAARQVWSSNDFHSAKGFEIDTVFADAAKDLWKSFGLDVTNADFTSLGMAGRKYNLILTNPPYVRHHHLSSDDKLRLSRSINDYLPIKISGLAGLYCYFMLIADRYLENDAISVWLIPSEFMDVNYGTVIKSYLTKYVTTLRIHRFDPSDVQFDDALVSSAIVIFRKKSPPKEHMVDFSFGGDLFKPANLKGVPLGSLCSISKWTSLPCNVKLKRNVSYVALGDLFTVKRGLATGDNSFFIMTPEEAKSRGIPKSCLKHVLPSPRFLKQSVIESDKRGAPQIDNQQVMIDTRCSIEEIEKKHPEFFSYLMSTAAKRVSEGYLASRRAPWYSQEFRDPPPFLLTYMGRGSERGKPFRVIWNKSQAVATNVYLLLYPKEPLRTALQSDPSLYKKVYLALDAIESSSFLSEGRVYGGGLHKVEPNELKKVDAFSVVEATGIELLLPKRLF